MLRDGFNGGIYSVAFDETVSLGFVSPFSVRYSSIIVLSKAIKSSSSLSLERIVDFIDIFDQIFDFQWNDFGEENECIFRGLSSDDHF